MHKFLLTLSMLGFVACSSSSGTNLDGKNNKKVDEQEARSQKCLKEYGLPSSLVKAEEHKFSPDCKYLELPEASLVSHYKLKLEKAPSTNECADVQHLLVKISDRKSRLVDFENRKRSEATDKYDKQIKVLSVEIESFVNNDVMANKSASVYVVPVKRHRLVDELKFMEQKGLSYSLDSQDMSGRNLVLKSYLVKDQVQSILDDSSNSISNLFFCSLAADSTKDQVYIEYQGRFNERPFVDIFDGVLD